MKTLKIVSLMFLLLGFTSACQEAGYCSSEDCPQYAGLNNSEEPNGNGGLEDEDDDGGGNNSDNGSGNTGGGSGGGGNSGLLPPAIEPIPDFTDPTGEGADEAFMIVEVTFDTGSFDLSPEFQEILEEFSLYILSRNPSKVIVHGHTDSVGTNADNQTLSDNRALTVENFLSDFDYLQFIAFDSEGFGEDRPIDTNDTAEGRQRNRRVELYLVF